MLASNISASQEASMKDAIRKKIEYVVYKKQKSTNYWWKLREKAKAGGIRGWIRKIQYNLYENKNNCFIPLKTVFKGIPTMPHGVSGVFISSGAVIGTNCTIMHQVTIGSNTFADSKQYGAPIIGDNVFVGCGAKIIGGVTIGNNVRIGANCVVTSNIPDNCTVVLEKPRIIQKDNNRNEFITYECFADRISRES